MKNGLYVVYDNVAKESGPIFQAKNDDVAVRNFSRMLSDEKVLNPADYNLIRLGWHDTESCDLKIDFSKTVIGVGDGE